MLKRIGRYEILDCVAALAAMVRSTVPGNTVLDRVVALKVINQPVADDPAYLGPPERSQTQPPQYSHHLLSLIAPLLPLTIWNHSRLYCVV